MKKAVIIRINDQDSSYIAELLLSKRGMGEIYSG